MIAGEFTELLEMRLHPQGINVDLKVRMIREGGRCYDVGEGV